MNIFYGFPVFFFCIYTHNGLIKSEKIFTSSAVKFGTIISTGTHSSDGMSSYHPTLLLMIPVPPNFKTESFPLSLLSLSSSERNNVRTKDLKHCHGRPGNMQLSSSSLTYKLGMQHQHEWLVQELLSLFKNSVCACSGAETMKSCLCVPSQ